MESFQNSKGAWQRRRCGAFEGGGSELTSQSTLCFYIQSPRKMLFILTVHSYTFLPFLYNLIYRLTELNISLFYLIKLIFFQKYLLKTTQR